MTAPCYNCPKRTLGCHSNCEDYIEFKKERNKINELKNKEREINSGLYEISRKRHRRLNKKVKPR